MLLLPLSLLAVLQRQLRSSAVPHPSAPRLLLLLLWGHLQAAGETRKCIFGIRVRICMICLVADVQLMMIQIRSPLCAKTGQRALPDSHAH